MYSHWLIPVRILIFSNSDLNTDLNRDSNIASMDFSLCNFLHLYVTFYGFSKNKGIWSPEHHIFTPNCDFNAKSTILLKNLSFDSIESLFLSLLRLCSLSYSLVPLLRVNFERLERFDLFET